MFRFNLNCEIGWSKSLAEKFTPRAGLFILLVLCFVSCTKDLDSSFPEDFVFDGSYYLAKISRTSDGVTFSELQSPNVGGVLKITGVNYFWDMTIGEDRGVDEGSFAHSGNALIFYSGTTDETKQGVYDLKDDSIILNYTSGDFLYTETWKRVKPVAGP